MKEVFRVINRMRADGIIDDYAICGAIAASFYLEAVATEDIDIFIHISPPPARFAELSTVYSYLGKKGFMARREFVVIDSWDVQFLVPAEDSLEHEAVRNAAVFAFDGVDVRVMIPEYLVAVALQTGRDKDMLRVREFVRTEKVNVGDLGTLVDRFGLGEQWRNANLL